MKKNIFKNKKDIIVASASVLSLILLILSIINFESVGMQIMHFLDKLKPMYDLSAAFGYIIAAALVIGLAISGIAGIVILILMLVLRKKQNIQKNLFKIYFFIIFLMQSYFISRYILELVEKQQFNFIKIINSIILLFSFTWYIYIPAIIILLVYLIIKSVSSINKGVEHANL